MNIEHSESVLRLFGAYKAEWLDEQLFRLFRRPQYFLQLSEAAPCVLVGGRGTGKTTVLKGLSYQGQLALNGGNAESIDEWGFFGIYQRVNTNRVSAFSGSELNEEAWGRYFSHYLNLAFCCQILEFCDWYETLTRRRIPVSSGALAEVCASLGLASVATHGQLWEALRVALAEFEGVVNNIAQSSDRWLSVAAAPIDRLVDAILGCQFLSGKSFYFLIDEFENLVDYQQRVLNTFIKHASTKYTFKIGVRELGWRDRRTINMTEILRHPADYSLISIGEYMNVARFGEFAREVCEGRLGAGTDDCLSIDELLPALSIEDEVVLLGAGNTIAETRREILEKVSAAQSQTVLNLSPARLYFLSYWARANARTLSDELGRISSDKARWEQDFENHGYASLFAIRRGKRGIRKYYAGWDVFVRIANGNIRFLLELVHKSLLAHFESQKSLTIPVSYRCQTIAAQAVGRQNLGELEGLSVEGARLTKLVLSLGRVFQVLAEQPEGHAPEVNQFEIDWALIASQKDEDALQSFLRHAVQHLALVRIMGTKPTEESDTKSFDFMLHPVFAPLFSYSHRRKRKMTLAPAEFWGLIMEPSKSISDVLSRTDRILEVDLPDQLQLFERYYA